MRDSVTLRLSSVACSQLGHVVGRDKALPACLRSGGRGVQEARERQHAHSWRLGPGPGSLGPGRLCTQALPLRLLCLSPCPTHTEPLRTARGGTGSAGIFSLRACFTLVMGEGQGSCAQTEERRERSAVQSPWSPARAVGPRLAQPWLSGECLSEQGLSNSHFLHPPIFLKYFIW